VDPVPQKEDRTPEEETEAVTGDNSAKETVRLLSDLLKAWGSIEGDENFNSKADLNDDGKIDGLDWLNFTKTWKESSLGMDSEKTMIAVLADVVKSWGAIEGNEDFDSMVDFNDDGKIDGLDWLDFSKMWNVIGPKSGEKAMVAMFSDLRNAWNSGSGDENFNATVDLNEDGKIDGLDWVRIRHDFDSNSLYSIRTHCHQANRKYPSPDMADNASRGSYRPGHAANNTP